ncbi:UNVERIFIED_CONTAM: hypothetical protein FKN15_063959 [Acipenser sinensis]
MTNRGSPVKAYDFLLKFLLVGDSDAGKGEILSSLQDGASESSYGYNMGLNVVKTVRVMLGETDPADSKPGTIRGDFCMQLGRTAPKFNSYSMHSKSKGGINYLHDDQR